MEPTRTKGRAQVLNGLGSAVITEIRVFNYTIHQKTTNECLTEDSVTMLKDQQQQQKTCSSTQTSTQYAHTNIYSRFYQNINTISWYVQTSVTIWLNEHLSSMTSHSEAFGGPLVLIKTGTSFSTQLWHNLKASQLAAKQLVFLLVSEDTQFQRNKVTQETYGPPKELLQCQNALIVCFSRKAGWFFLLLCPYCYCLSLCQYVCLFSDNAAPIISHSCLV